MIPHLKSKGAASLKQEGAAGRSLRDRETSKAKKDPEAGHVSGGPETTDPLPDGREPSDALFGRFRLCVFP